MGLLDFVKTGLNFLPGGALVSTGLDVAGQALRKGASDDAGKAARTASIGGMELAADTAEDKRLAAVQAAGGMMPQMQARGFMGLDPEIMAKLGARRDYTSQIEKAALDPTAGSGKAFLAGLTDTAGNIMSEYDLGQDMPDETMGTGILANAATRHFDPITGEPIE